MLSVIDISKRRTRFKQTPPGFKISTQNNINNNYISLANETPFNDHVSGSSSDDNHDPPIASNDRYGKADFISILQNLKSNSECSMHRTPSSTCPDRIHMKPVIEVARRRAKYHQAPPGFKQLPVLDVNNNARNSDRKGLVPKYSVAISESNKPSSTAKSGLVSCMKAVKSEIWLTSEEVESLKPQCLKGEDDGETSYREKNKGKLKTKRKKLVEENQVKTKKQKGPIFNAAIQRPDVVGEQEVVVNVMTFDSEEEELTEALDIRDTTPADFLDAFDYYEMVSENRKDMTRAVYMLGDLLIADKVEGDKEEWIHHTEQLFIDEKAWRRRCWDDNDKQIFNRTSAVKPSPKTRMLEYAKDNLAKIRTFVSDVCPCLF